MKASDLISEELVETKKKLRALQKELAQARKREMVEELGFKTGSVLAVPLKVVEDLRKTYGCDGDYPSPYCIDLDKFRRNRNVQIKSIEDNLVSLTHSSGLNFTFNLDSLKDWEVVKV